MKGKVLIIVGVVALVVVSVAAGIYIGSSRFVADEDVAKAKATSASGASATSTATVAPVATATPAVIEAPTLTPTPTPTPLLVVDCDGDRVEQYLDDLDSLLGEFDDAVTVASSTSRIALAPIVQDMQDLRRKTQRLEGPECISYLGDVTVSMMNVYIQAFVSFMTEKDNKVVRRQFDVAVGARKTVNELLDAAMKDSMLTYQAMADLGAALFEDGREPKPFTLPDGWYDIAYLGYKGPIVSAPSSWTYENTSDGLTLKSSDERLTVDVSVLKGGEFGDSNLDWIKFLQLQLYVQGLDYAEYSEEMTKVDYFGENKVYVIQYTYNLYELLDITERQLVGFVITPEGDQVLVVARKQDNQEFTGPDWFNLRTIFASIRRE